MKKQQEKPCFVYVNTARINNKNIVKIGITNNINKRLSEFNNGLKYRARFYPEIEGVLFCLYFNRQAASRRVAKKVERIVIDKLKSRSNPMFGREVFFSSPCAAAKCVENALGEVGCD